MRFRSLAPEASSFDGEEKSLVAEAWRLTGVAGTPLWQVCPDPRPSASNAASCGGPMPKRFSDIGWGEPANPNVAADLAA